MHHFAYRGGVMHAEDVDLRALAEEVGTPFYCYSTATLERHYGVFAEAFAGIDALVCYAMKANSNQAVIATLARLGAGRLDPSPPRPLYLRTPDAKLPGGVEPEWPT